MTTTDLIELLQRMEKGASNRSREISLILRNTKTEEELFVSSPDIEISSAGDGTTAVGLTLLVHVENYR